MKTRQQQVLVVGKHAREDRRLPEAGRDCFEFSYCAGGNQSVDSVKPGVRKYDWVLMDGGLMVGDQTEVFQSLRAIGFLTSNQSCVSSGSCRVEWTPEGVLELHCCLQSRRANTIKQGSDQRESLEGFVFEYHAPMKKTG